MPKKWVYIFVIVIILASLFGIFKIYQYLSSPISLAPVEDLMETNVEITVDVEGNDPSVTTLLKISVLDPLSTIEIGESFGFSIPKSAKNIKVKFNAAEINFNLEKSSFTQNLLTFNNPSNIKYNDESIFEITYNIKKIILKPHNYFEHTFTKFTNYEDYRLFIKMEKDAIVLSESKQPERVYILDDSKILSYNFVKGETSKISLVYEIESPPEKLIEVKSNYFTASVPSDFVDSFENILSNTDQGIKELEKIYNSPSPYNNWKISLIKYGDPDFGKEEGSEFKGFYLGNGEIRILITSLIDPIESTVYLINHEAAHGFHPQFDKNSWLNEGSAISSGITATESGGLDMSDLKQQYNELVESCQDSNSPSLTGWVVAWSPNALATKNNEFECSDLITNEVTLGYAYSYFIIEKMKEKYGEDIIGKIFNKARDENVKFSSDTLTRNTQIKSLLGQITEEDPTSFFNELNVKTRQTSITGNAIFDDENKDKSKALIFLVTIIILMIVAFTIKRQYNK